MPETHEHCVTTVPGVFTGLVADLCSKPSKAYLAASDSRLNRVGISFTAAFGNEGPRVRFR